MPRSASFKTLVEARDELLPLVSGQFSIIYMSKNDRAHYLQRLESWSQKFERLADSGAATFSASETRSAALLRLHKRNVSISLAGFSKAIASTTHDVMVWDDFTEEYDAMIHDATIALGLDEDDLAFATQFAGTPLQFHMDFGVLAALVSAAGNCRDPLFRRQALGLALLASNQEGIWNSTLSARVIRRLVDIEESGREVHSCHDIPRESRVLQIRVHLAPGDKSARIQFMLAHSVVEEVMEWK